MAAVTCCRNPHLIPLFFLILITCSVFPSISKQSVPPQVQGRDMKAAAAAGGRGVIGSRPPKCLRPCSTCRQCVAVQVPVVPQLRTTVSSTSSSSSSSSNHYYYYYTAIPFYDHDPSTGYNSETTDDQVSNYKPMSWKCKCGNSIFNP